MKSMWNEADRATLLARLGRLRPENPGGWGKMSCPQMLVHVADGLRMTFGDLTPKSKNLILRYPPLKQLIIYWLPFPKGAPTAPELLARAPQEWGAERADVEAQVRRFAAADDRPSWPDHPAFGSMSKRAWGVLAYRHLDHHLRQFGV